MNITQADGVNLSSANPSKASLIGGAQETITVAIDGPAGSGKSSVAKAAAAKLGYGMLDTGSAYRALTWHMLQTGADLSSQAQAVAALEKIDLQLPLTIETGAITVNGANVTAEIRAPEISACVSKVSRHPEVRAYLNQYFRDTIAKSGLAGVVVEGRDITTVVAPEAQVRIILTADEKVRAARRAAQLPELTLEQVAADLKARDAKDLKVVDFINPAPGVTLIDTSDLDFTGSVQAVIDAVQQVAEQNSGKK